MQKAINNAIILRFKIYHTILPNYSKYPILFNIWTNLYKCFIDTNHYNGRETPIYNVTRKRYVRVPTVLLIHRNNVIYPNESYCRMSRGTLCLPYLYIHTDLP